MDLQGLGRLSDPPATRARAWRQAFILIMKKRVFGRRFRRDKNERKALFRSLLSALVKSIKGEADKMVTKARKNTTNTRNLLQDFLTPVAITKMIDEIAPIFANRNGGYTRMTRIGRRFSDNASTVLLEWVDIEKIKPVKKETVKKVKAVKAPKTAKVSKTKVVKKAAPIKKRGVKK